MGKKRSPPPPPEGMANAAVQTHSSKGISLGFPVQLTHAVEIPSQNFPPGRIHPEAYTPGAEAPP
jgi:hypothetical protein